MADPTPAEADAEITRLLDFASTEYLADLKLRRVRQVQIRRLLASDVVVNTVGVATAADTHGRAA